MIYIDTFAPIRAGGPWATPGLAITGGDPGYQSLPNLNKPLPGIDADAPNRPPKPAARMLGAYELTWDLTGFFLPPEEEDSGWYVRVHAYIAVGPAGDLRHYAIDPCPDDASLTRLRLLRVSRPPLLTLSGLGSTHTMVVSEEISVASIRGEVRCFSPGSQPFDYGSDADSVLLWGEDRHGYELLE